ncbi:MAG: hypothetical protein RR510_10210 [Morganella sp. (in: enterobacteria)]
MNDDLCLNMLKNKLESFYDLTFYSDEERERYNEKIKFELVDFIISSYKNEHIDLVKKGLDLLFDNSGSHFDFAFLKKAKPLFIKNGVIDEKLFEDYLKKSPLSRWL